MQGRRCHEFARQGAPEGKSHLGATSRAALRSINQSTGNRNSSRSMNWGLGFRACWEPHTVSREPRKLPMATKIASTAGDATQRHRRYDTACPVTSPRAAGAAGAAQCAQGDDQAATEVAGDCRRSPMGSACDTGRWSHTSFAGMQAKAERRDATVPLHAARGEVTKWSCVGTHSVGRTVQHVGDVTC